MFKTLNVNFFSLSKCGGNKIFGTSKGNENWFQKSIVLEIEGKITVFD